jgi:hypothetical protein
MHHRNFIGGMRVGIGLVRPSVGSPSGVTDPDPSIERLFLKPDFQVFELALGAPPGQASRPAGVVPAILEPDLDLFPDVLEFP